MVPRKGLEPLHLWGQRILSPPCLPFHHLGIIWSVICITQLCFLSVHSTHFAREYGFNESLAMQARISAHLPFHHLGINLIYNLHYSVIFFLRALHSLCLGVWLQWVACNASSHFRTSTIPPPGYKFDL